MTHDTFRSVDSDEFLDEMKTMGWKPQNMANLIPVLLKVTNPNLKRN